MIICVRETCHSAYIFVFSPHIDLREGMKLVDHMSMVFLVWEELLYLKFLWKIKKKIPFRSITGSRSSRLLTKSAHLSSVQLPSSPYRFSGTQVFPSCFLATFSQLSKEFLSSMCFCQSFLLGYVVPLW